MVRHGHRGGGKRTPEYGSYRNAKERCNNPHNDAYPRYGGRGIKFLFTSFEQFYAEIGPRPKGLTLDRINNDGNYEPGNVQWATYLEQATNKRWGGRILKPWMRALGWTNP